MHSGRTINVLLVEDNDVDVEAVRRGFAKAKIANPVIVAKDGVEALEMLRDHRVPRPMVILTDLAMPRMTGIEMLREIRRDPGLKDSVVFVLTTSKSEEDKVASYDLNVAGYVVKSQVGHGFMHLITMLDHYWRIVELPDGPDG